jgi:hypothetical protein
MQSQRRIPLIEPCPIEDDFCTELADIEDLGCNARFVFAVRQTAYETGGPVLVLRRRIVLPQEILPTIELSLRHLTRAAAPRERPKLHFLRG